MFTRYVVPAIAAVLLVVLVWYVISSRREAPAVPPPADPPKTPFAATVAGAGLVEASSENIAVGAPESGLVEKVSVVVGQQVEAGAPLFRLDTRHMESMLRVREAMLLAAKADLERLKSAPRPEEIPVRKALLRQAEADLKGKLDNYQRMEKLKGTNAVTANEIISAEAAYQMAQAAAQKARADLELLEAGSWKPDIDIAQAAVARAQSEVEQVQTDLTRLSVTAPRSGQILRVNVREGEYVGAPAGDTLIVMGETKVLHIRVDIDEYDIARYRPGSPAIAIVRGAPKTQIPLKFVRVEPLVVPKRSLTGDNTERVDTRVLQVIYAVEGKTDRLYVGQQVDVFINVNEDEAKAARHSADLQQTK